MKLPSGPGAPAPADAAFGEATAACRAVSTLTAEIAVSGSVDGRGFRVRLLAGLAKPASARLEAVAPFGQPLFIFVARDRDATLLLPREGRALEHGQPETVLEAVTAVPLDASELRDALTGCVSPATDSPPARAFGDDWRVVSDGTRDVYLRRASVTGPWQLVAVAHRQPGRPAWRAEYRDFVNGSSRNLPRSVRLTTIDSNRFDLRLSLSQVETDTPLGPDVFQVRIPPDAQPVTVEELRRSAPVTNRSDGR